MEEAAVSMKEVPSVIAFSPGNRPNILKNMFKTAGDSIFFVTCVILQFLLSTDH